MSYVTQSELENVYGSANIRAWSNLDGSGGAANAARVAGAIAWAGAMIDARFADSIYALPLRQSDGSVPAVVRQWAAVLAAWNLYASRGLREIDVPGERLEAVRKSVEVEMRRVVEGRIVLHAEFHSNCPLPPHGLVVVE